VFFAPKKEDSSGGDGLHFAGFWGGGKEHTGQGERAPGGSQPKRGTLGDRETRMKGKEKTGSLKINNTNRGKKRWETGFWTVRGRRRRQAIRFKSVDNSAGNRKPGSAPKLKGGTKKVAQHVQGEKKKSSLTGGKKSKRGQAGAGNQGAGATWSVPSKRTGKGRTGWGAGKRGGPL